MSVNTPADHRRIVERFEVPFGPAGGLTAHAAALGRTIARLETLHLAHEIRLTFPGFEPWELSCRIHRDLGAWIEFGPAGEAVLAAGAEDPNIPEAVAKELRAYDFETSWVERQGNLAWSEGPPLSADVIAHHLLLPMVLLGLGDDSVIEMVIEPCEPDIGDVRVDYDDDGEVIDVTDLTQVTDLGV